MYAICGQVVSTITNMPGVDNTGDRTAHGRYGINYWVFKLNQVPGAPGQDPGISVLKFGIFRELLTWKTRLLLGIQTTTRQEKRLNQIDPTLFAFHIHPLRSPRPPQVHRLSSRNTVNIWQKPETNKAGYQRIIRILKN